VGPMLVAAGSWYTSSSFFEDALVTWASIAGVGT
jgi:hypothetical protein